MDGDVEPMAQLRRLTRLSLWNTLCTDAACEWIARLNKLTSVDLYAWKALTLDGVRRLAQLPNLQTITLLHFPQLQSVQDEVRALFPPPVTLYV
jgi:hypothetical protein